MPKRASQCLAFWRCLKQRKTRKKTGHGGGSLARVRASSLISSDVTCEPREHEADSMLPVTLGCTTRQSYPHCRVADRGRTISPGVPCRAASQWWRNRVGSRRWRSEIGDRRWGTRDETPGHAFAHCLGQMLELVEWYVPGRSPITLPHTHHCDEPPGATEGRDLQSRHHGYAQRPQQGGADDRPRKTFPTSRPQSFKTLQSSCRIRLGSW